MTTKTAKQTKKSSKAKPAKKAVTVKVFKLATVPIANLPRIGAPLADGVFAGIARGEKDGDPDIALVDLGLSDTSMPWAAANKWAGERFGVAPSREEARILWANLDRRTGQTPGWFWLRDQFAGDAAYAWVQYFGGGGQHYDHKGGDYRARAVRRLVIQ